MSARRIEAVDGLRGIAILMVIFEHIYKEATAAFISETFGVYPWLTNQGFLGVGIFFVLSGFVLTLPFADGKRTLSTRSDVSNFYTARAMRLYPLFVFIATLSFAVTVHAGSPQTAAFILSLTTLNMFSYEHFFPAINFPLWSLSIEIWFCILFPFIYLAMQRFGVIKVLLCISAIALAVRCYGSFVEYPNAFINPVKDSVVARADDFAVGMAVAIAYSRGLLPKLGLGSMFAGVSLVQIAAIGWDFQDSIRPAVGLLNIPLQLGTALILISSLNAKSILTAWPLRVLGAMCFSLYVWHALVMGHTILASPFSATNLLIFWVPLLLLSAFTYRFIEFPKANFVALFRLGSSHSAGQAMPANSPRNSTTVG